MTKKQEISTQREGYYQLIDLCLQESKRTELKSFVNRMENYNGRQDYMTTLNFLMHYLDNNSIYLIMALDWKADIPTLIWRIDSSLFNNFQLEVELPKPQDYPKNASVSFNNVFKASSAGCIELQMPDELMKYTTFQPEKFDTISVITLAKKRLPF